MAQLGDELLARIERHVSVAKRRNTNFITLPGLPLLLGTRLLFIRPSADISVPFLR